MSDTEVKDTVQDAGKAVTPEPSSSKDDSKGGKTPAPSSSKDVSKGGKTPAVATDAAGEDVPLPTFKPLEIELGLILYRCIKKSKGENGKPMEPEIDHEKFAKLGGYTKGSVATIICRLKKKITLVENAGGESYNGYDTSAAKGSKTPKNPGTAVLTVPKTPAGGKSKRKAIDDNDAATPKTKKARASNKKAQQEADDGDAGDEDVLKTPVTPKTVGEGADGEAETPKTKKPRAPRKKAGEGATPGAAKPKGRGRKKGAAAEVDSTVDNAQVVGESSTDAKVNNGGEEKSTDAKVDNGGEEKSTDVDGDKATAKDDGDKATANKNDSD